MPDISLRDVSFAYPGGSRVLDQVSLEVENGTFLAVVGPSGCGKSTLLRLISGLSLPDEGTVSIGGAPVTGPAPGRSIVFQQGGLFPWLTARGNVAFALRVTNVASRSIRQRVPYVLGLVGLAAKARNYPDQLSGGEQQRVALARALVNNPPLLIADEPTGNIDPELSFEIVELLNEINRCGTTVVMVTHEHELVSRFNRRVITINHGNVVGDGGIDDSDEWRDFYEG